MPLSQKKTILITGSTDGIGLETATLLASEGHHVLLHGRTRSKLEAVTERVAKLAGADHTERIESYEADLSSLTEVAALAQTVARRHDTLDVLINNAGVYKTSSDRRSSGRNSDELDVRFVVNTIAPYLLTRRLLERLAHSGRVINLSSAAQSPVDLEALNGKRRLSDDAAYAQSKLALTMWSRSLALEVGDRGPMIVAVNPGSLLGTKMVKEAYAVAGGDVRIGADILHRAALSEDFQSASGRYFDNDSGRFASPHPDALDERRCQQVTSAVEKILVDRGHDVVPIDDLGSGNSR